MPNFQSLLVSVSSPCPGKAWKDCALARDCAASKAGLRRFRLRGSKAGLSLLRSYRIGASRGGTVPLALARV